MTSCWAVKKDAGDGSGLGTPQSEEKGKQKKKIKTRKKEEVKKGGWDMSDN